VAREMNWLIADAPEVGTQVDVQVRHHAAPARAEIVRTDGDEIELALDEPVSAISPGQSLVIYRGERVLGGGVIEVGHAMRAARARLPIFAA
jgi:Predicted tRNA(5-methylaminomethyl-2-thiouridylate) methyltransferase, contains the PP-loop ATPase domain